MSFADLILKLVYPPRCAICGELIEASAEYVCFCEKCRSLWEQEKETPCPVCRQTPDNCICELQYNKSRTLDACRSLASYDGDAVKKLIFGIKNSADKDLFIFIGRELEMLIFRKADLSDGDCVIAYPQRNKKARKKHGHDQAYLLAKTVSKDLGIPLFEGIKNVRGKEQKKLSERGRGENAYKSYVIPEKYKGQLKGKRVILIDDIVTTGATAVSCAALCKLDGALSVSCFCVAKTPRRFLAKGDPS